MGDDSDGIPHGLWWRPGANLARCLRVRRPIRHPGNELRLDDPDQFLVVGPHSSNVPYYAVPLLRPQDVNTFTSRASAGLQFIYNTFQPGQAARTHMNEVLGISTGAVDPVYLILVDDATGVSTNSHGILCPAKRTAPIAMCGPRWRLHRRPSVQRLYPTRPALWRSDSHYLAWP